VEGSDDYIDIISAKELRANKPLVMSQLELEYFGKQKYKQRNYNSRSIITLAPTVAAGVKQ
jgi:hypothetical protein